MRTLHTTPRSFMISLTVESGKREAAMMSIVDDFLDKNGIKNGVELLG